MKGKMPGFPLYRECAAGARRAADQGYPARSARPIPAGLPPIQGLKVDANTNEKHECIQSGEKF
jgi:hypothetical protein